MARDPRKNYPWYDPPSTRERPFVRAFDPSKRVLHPQPDESSSPRQVHLIQADPARLDLIPQRNDEPLIPPIGLHEAMRNRNQSFIPPNDPTKAELDYMWKRFEDIPYFDEPLVPNDIFSGYSHRRMNVPDEYMNINRNHFIDNVAVWLTDWRNVTKDGAINRLKMILAFFIDHFDLAGYDLAWKRAQIKFWREGSVSNVIKNWSMRAKAAEKHLIPNPILLNSITEKDCVGSIVLMQRSTQIDFKQLAEWVGNFPSKTATFKWVPQIEQMKYNINATYAMRDAMKGMTKTLKSVQKQHPKYNFFPEGK